MEFDALILARMQFAFTVAFHIVFPAFSIGLASYLAVLEGLWLKTGRDLYLNLFNYWLKIFAVAFGMGVVSGLVMSYQFGTNWSVFSDKAGPVIGPLMAYEVLSAFFLEAGFLGVMLFGLKRVGKKLHFLATLMVAIGTFASAFWILSVNSWMQTPQGYAINDVGQFVPADWFKIVFNPSFPYRLAHMLLAAYLTTGLVVGAVGAWHLLKERTNKGARKMFAMATGMILVAAPVQIFIGDMHGLNTLEHQPAKLAAMEGIWKTEKGVPAVLFGLPDEKAKENRYEIAIPKLASLYLTHSLDGEVKGLDQFEGKHPPVAPVFWAFRIMVGVGLLMLAVSWTAAWQLTPRKKGPGRSLSPWLARVLLAMTFAGWVALIAGWYVTEIGRQPWLVTGVLTAAEAASTVPAPRIALTLSLYLTLYAALIVAYISVVFYLARHRKQADKPFGTGLEDTPNPVTYPEQEGAPHA